MPTYEKHGGSDLFSLQYQDGGKHYCIFLGKFFLKTARHLLPKQQLPPQESMRGRMPDHKTAARNSCISKSIAPAVQSERLFARILL